jgi:hypothetical protein
MFCNKFKIPPAHDLFNFGWAYFGCYYSNPLSSATSPTILMLVPHGRTKCGGLLGRFSIISPSISMMMMSEGNRHDLSSRDTREQSNRCTEQRRSSILGAGSWRPFWFDHIFRSMIFGQVMAKVRHGGGSRIVGLHFGHFGGCPVWCVWR